MSGKRKNSNQNYFAPDYNEDEASRWTNNRRRKKIKELELKYSSNNIRNNLIEDNVGVKTNSLNASEVSSLDNVFHVESNINFSDHVPHTYNSTPMSVNNTNDRFQECTLEDNQVSSDGKNQKSSDNENEESSNEENLDSSVEENEESSDEENLDSSDEENQESTDEEVIVDNANIHHGCFTKDNRIMFPSSELSVSDVLLMIKGFNIKFGTTRAMQQALLDFVKVLAGPNFELWDYSTYKLSKTLAPPKETIQKKYYCTECSILLIDLDISRTKKIKVLCHECQKMYEITSESHNYIIALDIKFQLNNLFNQPHIQKSMKINFEKIHNKTTSSISDITDSILFNENIKDPDIMTFNFSADGAQLFESSQKSMWPLQLTLNCLNGKDRFKYPILVALWETEHEPSAKFMNFYLSELKVQCDRINENGIQIVDNINGEITNWRMICPFSANVDTVARPIMQNRIQFNGYYGCSWCYHPGLYTVTMRYPLLDQRVPDPVLRSHTSHLEDLEWVKSSGCLSERGVKGPCSLLDLKNFDIVWNLPPDYMHGSLMGVTKQLHASWKKSLKKEKYNRLIERMSNIRLTNAFQRSLRSLKFVGKYKALEWKMWLLYRDMANKANDNTPNENGDTSDQTNGKTNKKTVEPSKKNFKLNDEILKGHKVIVKSPSLKSTIDNQSVPKITEQSSPDHLVTAQGTGQESFDQLTTVQAPPNACETMVPNSLTLQQDSLEQKISAPGSKFVAKNSQKRKIKPDNIQSSSKKKKIDPNIQSQIKKSSTPKKASVKESEIVKASKSKLSSEKKTQVVKTSSNKVTSGKGTQVKKLSTSKVVPSKDSALIKSLQDEIEIWEHNDAIKNKKIASLEKLNMELQEEVIERFKQINSLGKFDEIAQPTVDGPAAVGYHDTITNKVHCGGDVWVDKVCYDNASEKGIMKFNLFVTNILMGIFEASELKLCSISGRGCNRTGGKPKQILDPTKRKAVTSISEFFLKSRNFDDITIIQHIDQIKVHIRTKIAEVIRSEEVKDAIATAKAEGIELIKPIRKTKRKPRMKDNIKEDDEKESDDNESNDNKEDDEEDDEEVSEEDGEEDEENNGTHQDEQLRDGDDENFQPGRQSPNIFDATQADQPSNEPEVSGRENHNLRRPREDVPDGERPSRQKRRRLNLKQKLHDDEEVIASSAAKIASLSQELAESREREATLRAEIERESAFRQQLDDLKNAQKCRLCLNPDTPSVMIWDACRYASACEECFESYKVRARKKYMSTHDNKVAIGYQCPICRTFGLVGRIYY
uniref:RING-type domain-containing protein n=1 Tax=Trichogramma kaykai TaxID=54128 RepID=A0ABD2X0U9_9HYME